MTFLENITGLTTIKKPSVVRYFLESVQTETIYSYSFYRADGSRSRSPSEKKCEEFMFGVPSRNIRWDFVKWWIIPPFLHRSDAFDPLAGVRDSVSMRHPFLGVPVSQSNKNRDGIEKKGW